MRFGVRRIETFASTGRSYAYAQAGFLPTDDQAWGRLAGKLLTQLPGVATEFGLSGDLVAKVERTILAGSGTTVRMLAPNPVSPAQSTAFVLRHPQAFVQLWKEVSWEGELDFDDDESAQRYAAFVGERSQ